MKKTLLILVAAVAVTTTAMAQKVWNFSEAPFGASPTVNFASTFTHNDLVIGTDGTALFSLDANNKSLDGISFTHRLKTGGGGAPAAGSFIPTTRYLKMAVSGPSSVDLYMMSSSSSAERIMYICNTDATVVDSIVGIGGSALAKYTYNYTGTATSLYFYSKSSGINYYMISATNVISSVKNPVADLGVTFNGIEILNPNKVSLEVYNVLGKKVAVSNTNISVTKFEKGVYFVRTPDAKGAMKFSK